MRTLNIHSINSANKALDVFVLDTEGHGGACHLYFIGVPVHTELDPLDGFDQDRPDPIASDGAVKLYLTDNNCYVLSQPSPTGECLRAYSGESCVLNFQNGPLKDTGVNGITHEVLLAVLIDRLSGFARGKYACMANEQALIDLHSSLNWLSQRTLDRIRRNVEGTHQL